METEKALLDGKNIDVVVSLDEEFTKDYLYIDEELENTLEFNKEELEALNEQTMEIESVNNDGQGNKN